MLIHVGNPHIEGLAFDMNRHTTISSVGPDLQARHGRGQDSAADSEDVQYQQEKK